MDILIHMDFGGTDHGFMILHGTREDQRELAVKTINAAADGWYTDHIPTNCETLDEYIEMRLREQGIQVKFAEYELVTLELFG